MCYLIWHSQQSCEVDLLPPTLQMKQRKLIKFIYLSKVSELTCGRTRIWHLVYHQPRIHSWPQWLWMKAPIYVSLRKQIKWSGFVDFSGRIFIVSRYGGPKGIKNSLGRYSLENFFQDDQINYCEQVIFRKCLDYETLMEVNFASGCSPTISTLLLGRAWPESRERWPFVPLFCWWS